MKTKIITLLIFLLFLNSCATTEKSSYSEFDKAYTNFIELATAEFGTKYGMAIAVVKDDHIIFEKYLGIADVEKKIKVSEKIKLATPFNSLIDCDSNGVVRFNIAIF